MDSETVSKARRDEKCSFVSESGQYCFRPKSKKFSIDENPKGYCKYHFENLADTKSTDSFNSVCAICLEEGETAESGKLYPLSCSHRFHVNCLSGMTKAECPMCRKPAINLPKSVKGKIDENERKYKQETNEQEEREFREMIESEAMSYQAVRLPPQIEIILAMKYIVELGIPVSMIPIDTILELDPQSPLPDPGSIFQNTVKLLIEVIQKRTLSTTEEDDPVENDEDELVLDGDENPFEFEGEDLQIVHTVRTVPMRGISYSRSLFEAARSLFSTMSFQIANLPDLTQEDLINLRMGIPNSEDEF
jgi:hypothetical protein